MRIDNDAIVDSTLEEIDDNTAVSIEMENSSGSSSAGSVPFSGLPKLLLLSGLFCVMVDFFSVYTF